MLDHHEDKEDEGHIPHSFAVLWPSGFADCVCGCSQTVDGGALIPANHSKDFVHVKLQVRECTGYRKWRPHDQASPGPLLPDKPAHSAPHRHRHKFRTSSAVLNLCFENNLTPLPSDLLVNLVVYAMLR